MIVVARGDPSSQTPLGSPQPPHRILVLAIIGVAGLLLLGLPLMVYWRLRHPAFFARRRETAETVAALAPPLTPGVTPGPH